MARITGSYPDDLGLLNEGAVEAGVFGSKSDALREFAREYFDDHENGRIAAAVALYERERITLGDAARLADVDRWTMRESFVSMSRAPTRARRRGRGGL